ncbi:IS91 family transposase [Blautia sp. Marseille-P3201T]|uniref:IS91 family transposase n=1 Tax=Blautia sp. Marseille-P3201T TaxID=1907659 RepID=UPI0009300619
MNILQKIFTDYYEEIKYTLHPRKTEMENIDKMIHCGDPSFSGAMYACTHCGNLKFVPFRCHSRFCPTCGIKYSMERSTSMAFKLIQSSHRHCVFTIDKNLRDFFLKDRTLLDCLFHSVNSVVSRMFFKINQSKNFTPGFLMVLHTFGRDLKWNPHIHCLISEGGLSDDGLWKPVKHFNYTFLRNAFRTALLNEMETLLGSSFKKVKAKCYDEHKQGFYVYARPNLCDPKAVIRYIGRYLGRPVIAVSRIDSYDGEMVTFHYNRHEDDQYIQETIPAMDFIKRLIRHIPEKHFKMIRYGGLYARHRKTDAKLYRAIPKSRHRIYRSFNLWRNAILSSFGYDPLECPGCRHKMEFLELYYNHQRVSLEELYEKAMSKFLGKRSSA